MYYNISFNNQPKQKPSQSNHFPCDESCDGVTWHNSHNALFCNTKIPALPLKRKYWIYFPDLCWQPPTPQARGATRLILISSEPTKDENFPLFREGADWDSGLNGSDYQGDGQVRDGENFIISHWWPLNINLPLLWWFYPNTSFNYNHYIILLHITQNDIIISERCICPDPFPWVRVTLQLEQWCYCKHGTSGLI